MKKINIQKYASSASFALFGFEKSDIFYVVIAISAVVFPIFIFFYADRFFWKIIEMRHRFRMKKISKKPSIAGILLSDLDHPDDIFKSEGNNFKDNPGNFLSLANGIDNQLRFVASEIVGKPIPEDTDRMVIFKIVKKGKFFTGCGKKKIKFIHWLRDMVHAGRVNYLSDKTMQMGVCLCWELHQEINRWLKSKV
jgi:hypothetical protein